MSLNKWCWVCLSCACSQECLPQLIYKADLCVCLHSIVTGHLASLPCWVNPLFPWGKVWGEREPEKGSTTLNTEITKKCVYTWLYSLKIYNIALLEILIVSRQSNTMQNNIIINDSWYSCDASRPPAVGRPGICWWPGLVTPAKHHSTHILRL